ncbi:MAG: M28 family peptidase [candidate division Zixibacteria bacterium]
MKKILLLSILTLCFSSSSRSDDLLQVSVETSQQASALSATGVRAIARLDHSFLVLADQSSQQALESTNLKVELIAKSIRPDELAFDHRGDRQNTLRFNLLFESDAFRLFRVEPSRLKQEIERGELLPLADRFIPIELKLRPTPTFSTLAETDISLDSLIALINQDTVQSWLERLQAFNGREMGTDSNYASRDWIAAKLSSIGYNDIAIDSFNAMGYDSVVPCQNVLAVKTGTLYPHHYIVVGAHRDAVPLSPGADDNGTGTIGVMTIAAALVDIDTEMSIVFALFDGEEKGLWGSWHYASRAFWTGQNIVHMLNMDMIGHYTNDTAVNVFHGSHSAYGQLWIDLADSLVGLSGRLAGNSSGSDHYPFTQYDYPASFVAERFFSNVYHSPRDSTTYINYDYMTKIIKASLATVYTISETVEPDPSVIFQPVTLLPDFIEPATVNSFEVDVVATFGGQLVDGSAMLHYQTDNLIDEIVPLVPLGGDRYQATVSELPCDGQLRYYLSVEEISTGIWQDTDASQPNRSTILEERTVFFSDDFETDQGWTVMGTYSPGRWERGSPAGGLAAGAPLHDFDRSGQCWLTGNGVEGDVDNGATVIVSPIYDMTGTDYMIGYARWLNTSRGPAPFEDRLLVQISNNNGSSWVTADSAGPITDASGGWISHAFLVSDFVEPNEWIRVRFWAEDYGFNSMVEAAIDAFTMETRSCEYQFICGDINADGTGPDITDLTFLVNYMFLNGDEPPIPENANVNGVGDIDISDLTMLVNYMFLHGSEVACFW